jgi:chromosomal replication initiator protein
MNVAHEQIWQDFLKIIREEVGSRVVETWIKAVTFSHYDVMKRELYVVAPNVFVKNWVEIHYKELFHKHLKRLFGVEQMAIFFTVHAAGSSVVLQEQSQSSKILPAIQEPVRKKRNELVKKSVNSANVCPTKLNPAYMFDTFVVGDNNQFAYASAQAVAEKLGSLYNPLLLYGGSGLGKTHLLHAIGNHVLLKNSNLVVLYQTADRFISEFIHAIRFDGVAKFQAKYKEVDVLLVDDIQFMVNKEQTQEVFFHIFNNLYDANKQIVLSCDTLPRYLGGLADRLKSRLEWGLIADVQIPQLETKIAILKRKAFLQGETIGEDVAQFIAQQNIYSVRELEGALIRVLAYASLTNQTITVELARKVLGVSYEPKPMVGNIDFNAVVTLIKKHFSYDLHTLRSKDRSQSVSHARHMAMYLMKQHTNKSLREIGEFLERKDHSTITHAVQRIAKLRAQDEKMANFLKNMEEELQ